MGRNNKTGELTAVITEFQRFSVHDGPGIRTLVFFKGCPLRCKWCQNPETFIAQPEIMFNSELCIGCGNCIEDCPQKAIYVNSTGMVTDWEKCNRCGKCTDRCYSEARRVVGKWLTVSETMKEILKDRVFFENSGGGVTLSGGEVTMYPDFATELLKELQSAGVHTAIETCGHCKWEDMQRLLAHTDLVLFDLKHSDPEKHKHFTGTDNTLILENLSRASEMGKSIIIRIPLVPGVNDDEKTLNEMANIAKKANVTKIHLLPFHQIGEKKWEDLNLDYTFKNVESMQNKDAEAAKRILEKAGLQVNIGGTAS